MTPLEKQELFEWLDAGRALGDLSAEEQAEWETLAKELGDSAPSGASFDAIVAALEVGMSPDQELPTDLKARVRSDAATFQGDRGMNRRPQLLTHPYVGWALAACLVLALFVTTGEKSATEPPTLDQVASEEDVLRLDFTGLGDYTSLSGEVLWSDQIQQGVMRLRGLAANDPQTAQYQLWIVDPERDEHPVDGGVFDISTEGEVIIPIDCKLLVTDPRAFVITLEQPGGVVVSKQDVVVALAKI